MRSPLFRYMLLQVPGVVGMALVLTLLWKWMSLPPWLAVTIFVLWIAKDAALYPFVRSAFEPSVVTGVEELIGRKGITRDALEPQGYVALRGELWKAEVAAGHSPIPPAQSVQVQSVRGLTLIVTAERTLPLPPPTATPRT
jgi:membrane protein implicated in regulation of membrane protease activity